MFDLLGGFVVKTFPATSRDRLSAALSQLQFTTYTVDAVAIDDKAKLFGVLHETLVLSEFSDNPANGWDSFSDFLWQRVMFGNTTKLALVVNDATHLIRNNIDLLLQLAEVLIHLESDVTRARKEEGETGLRVRLFLESP